VNPTSIGVAVNHGAVTLSGEVESYPEKVQAGEAALRVRGVTGIAQEIVVRSIFGSANDVDIARAAADAIDRAIDLPAGAVKVAVHNHTVTLTGVVAWHYQHDSASRAVRYLKGVHDVINIIEIKPTVSSVGIKTALDAALLRNAALDAEHTTVTTDPSGTVTLTGTVQSWAERQDSEQVAWAAPGVRAVINQLLVQN
jgi:osmotically-inducible protein OsmY